MTETFPLSRPISASDVPPDGETVTFSADAAEREALAETFGLSEMVSLTANLLVKPWRGDGLSVAGPVTAVVVQPCVVTLVPVTQTIEEEIALRFQPQSRLRTGTGDIEVDPTGEDPPDVFDGESIDLGAIAAEHIALGIDPYPRAPGAEFASNGDDSDADDEEPSPFAVLEQLKRGRSE